LLFVILARETEGGDKSSGSKGKGEKKGGKGYGKGKVCMNDDEDIRTFSMLLFHFFLTTLCWF
jgi:hypothetical protein